MEKWPKTRYESRYTSTTLLCNTRGKTTRKSHIKRTRKGTHKYNTKSRLNHVTTFKNTPQMFKNYMTDTSITHTGSDCIDHIDPPKYTITVEPTAHHITYETTGKILGYRYLVKMDAPVCTDSMCNELGRLSQGWKAHAGTDTINYISHKDKPKEIRETYVRAVCNI